MSSRRKRSKQRRLEGTGQTGQPAGGKPASARKRSGSGMAVPASKAKTAVRPVQAPQQKTRRPRERTVVEVGPDVPLDRVAFAAAGAVGLLTFVVYVLTLTPSVPNGDSGELITAAYVLGVAHPPGYPLLTMLGHVATWLPFGSPALRVNLLSSLFGAAAVSVVFLAVYRLVGRSGAAILTGRRPWPAYVAGAVGSLLLGFSTLFWTYSVGAEVFALNNLFAALLLFLAIEWCRRPERHRLLWAFALVFGLALTNQQTIVLLVPAFLVLAWFGWSALRRAGDGRSLSLRNVGIACGLFVAGLLPYLYLPIAASTDPVVNWGNPTSLGRFVDVVTRASYGSTSLTAGGEKGSVGEQLGLLSTDLAGGFVVVGLVLALLGLWWAWRWARPEGLALLLAFLFAGPMFAAYANPAFPDDLTRGVVARFYILPSIPIGLLAGAGAWWLLVQAASLRLPRLRPAVALGIASACLLAVPVAAAAVHYGTADQSDNYVGMHYAQDVLGPLAPNALLLMRGDENFTTVGYAQNVAHFRPDVAALDTELLKLPNYVAKKKRQYPGLVIPFESYDGGRTMSLNELVRANLGRRPVYYIGVPEEKQFGAPFDKVRVGLTRQLLTKGTAPKSEADLVRAAEGFEQLHVPRRSYPSKSWEAAIGVDYGSVAFDLAYALQTAASRSNVELQEQLYRDAIRLVPNLASAYKNLGLVLQQNGGDAKEIVAVWSRFLELEPDAPQAAAIEAAVEQLQSQG